MSYSDLINELRTRLPHEVPDRTDAALVDWFAGLPLNELFAEYMDELRLTLRTNAENATLFEAFGADFFKRRFLKDVLSRVVAFDHGMSAVAIDGWCDDGIVNLLLQRCYFSEV